MKIQWLDFSRFSGSIETVIGNIDERINAVLALCQAANKQIKAWGSKEHKAAESALWKAMRQLEEDAGPGVVPGKFVKFAVGGGYAKYIVKNVKNKKHVTLVHLPYCEALKSPAVNAKGDCDYAEVEGRIEWEEGLRKIMAEHRAKRLSGVIEPQ